jgi:sortase A
MLETTEGTIRHYVVQETGIVDAHNASIHLDDEHNRLVLVTCYPFDAIVPGGPLRYVVTAVEVAVEGSSATVETSS